MSLRENLTDLGNARRLVHRHGARIRFVHAWDRWLVFADGRWVLDMDEHIRRFAKEAVCSLYAEAAALGDDERKQLIKWGQQSESRRRIIDMVHLARSEPGVPCGVEELDAHPLLLNVANGTLDLATGRLRDADSSDFLTKQAPVSYHAGATCPRFLGFLERVLAGDQSMINYLQRIIGYVLTGLTSEQCLFLLYGLGSNGKSTLLEILRAMLGRDYAVVADFSLLLERSHHGGPRNDVAALHGARLVTASEVPESARLNETLVKALTGGERLSARRLYEEAFEFVPTFKVLAAVNDKPQIRSTGHAIWRRVRLLPFLVTIPDTEKDLQFASRLIAEELPGILAWAVQGCLSWQRDGLGLPPAVAAATAEYRAESDQVGQFLEECCSRVPGGSVRADALYAAYSAWARARGEESMTQTMFGRKLPEHALRRDADPITRRVIYLDVNMTDRDADVGALGPPTGVSGGLHAFSVNFSHARVEEGVSGKHLPTPANPRSEAQLERDAIRAESVA